jgi:hypothetical protein
LEEEWAFCRLSTKLVHYSYIKQSQINNQNAFSILRRYGFQRKALNRRRWPHAGCFAIGAQQVYGTAVVLPPIFSGAIGVAAMLVAVVMLFAGNPSRADGTWRWPHGRLSCLGRFWLVEWAATSATHGSVFWHRAHFAAFVPLAYARRAPVRLQWRRRSQRFWVGTLFWAARPPPGTSNPL